MTKSNVIERMVDTLEEMIEEMENWSGEDFHLVSELARQLADELESID